MHKQPLVSTERADPECCNRGTTARENGSKRRNTGSCFKKNLRRVGTRLAWQSHDRGGLTLRADGCAARAGQARADVEPLRDAVLARAIDSACGGTSDRNGRSLVLAPLGAGRRIRGGRRIGRGGSVGPSDRRTGRAPGSGRVGRSASTGAGAAGPAVDARIGLRAGSEEAIIRIHAADRQRVDERQVVDAVRSIACLSVERRDGGHLIHLVQKARLRRAGKVAARRLQTVGRVAAARRPEGIGNPAANTINNVCKREPKRSVVGRIRIRPIGARQGRRLLHIGDELAISIGVHAGAGSDLSRSGQSRIDGIEDHNVVCVGLQRSVDGAADVGAGLHVVIILNKRSS